MAGPLAAPCDACAYRPGIIRASITISSQMSYPAGVMCSPVTNEELGSLISESVGPLPQSTRLPSIMTPRTESAKESTEAASSRSSVAILCPPEILTSTNPAVRSWRS